MGSEASSRVRGHEQAPLTLELTPGFTLTRVAGMATEPAAGLLRIGEVAARSGTRVDTVRYYERLGLLGIPARTSAGYRAYGAVDLGRLPFIPRAKRLGFSLVEIRGLLGLAEDGECKPLRRQIAELLRTKIEE